MAAAYTLEWNAPLRARNTLRVDAQAHCRAVVHEAGALPSLLDDPELRGLPVLVLGEGSNVLFTEPMFPGVVVQLACARVQLLDDDGAAATAHVEAAHGWDALVDWTLARGLAGLENLALIPGHAGAAPIQNIGAYGVEVGTHIVAVHAWDRAERRFARLPRDACAFGYRDSRFKREPDRWIVTAVEFRLSRDGHVELGYAGLAEELVAMGLDASAATPRDVAAAVRRVRRRKLPDPAVVGNAGSFFKNPVVPEALALDLGTRHANLPSWPAGDGRRKLSAAWLIERAGWRGFRDGDAGISAQHALVLVNHGRASGAQLLGVARRVAESVEREFGVRLEPEPRLIGAAF